MRKFNPIFLVLGFALTVGFAIASTPATASGYVAGSVQYNSGGGNVQHGSPVIVTQYPSGRVVITHVPVTHVYPNGENLVYQNGGDRVYTKGYGGAATCYVDCWHGGVSPNSGSGSNISIGVGISAQGNF